jgi:hypothetical protein
MPFGGLVGMGQGGGLDIPDTIGGAGGASTKKPSNWWALAGAPLIALLGSKLGGIDYKEALGAVGQGFANHKYESLKQKRAQEFDEENRIRDMAHESAMKLKDFTPEVIQKFPKLGMLSQKYQDALANDGKISPKEAQELVIYSKMAEADMASAKQAQKGMNEEQDFNREAELKQGFESEQMGRAMEGTEGAPPEMLRDVGQTALDQQRLASLPQLTSVNIGDQTREIAMTPQQQFSLAKEEQDRKQAEARDKRLQEHQMKIEASRERSEALRARGEERRAQEAEFQTAKLEWDFGRKMELMKLASEYGSMDYIPPEALDAFEKKWTAAMPRKDRALAGKGARPPKDTIAAPPKLATPAPSGRFKIKNVQ